MKETRPGRLLAGPRLIGWLYQEAVDDPRVYARCEETEPFEEVRARILTRQRRPR